MKYMLELHNVPHEITMYVEEIKLYGEVMRHTERYPQYVWIDSPWDKDIIETIMGVKQVWAKRYDSTPIGITVGRNWAELEGTKWEENSQ